MALYSVLDKVNLGTYNRMEDRILLVSRQFGLVFADLDGQIVEQWRWEDIHHATIKSRLRTRVNVHRWNGDKFEFDKKKLTFESSRGMDLFFDFIKDDCTKAEITQIPLVGCKKCILKKPSSTTTILGSEITIIRQAIDLLEDEPKEVIVDKDTPLIQF